MTEPQPKSSTTPERDSPVFSSQEMDSPARSLPPVVPVLLAAIIVGAIVFFIARSNRAVTPASGSITKVFAVEQNTKDRVLVGVEVHLKNGSDKPIYVRDVTIRVTPATGDPITDNPAPGSEVPRYYQAYPALKQSNAEWIGDNTKLMPGAEQDGLFIVGYTLTKEQWDQRKALEVTINLYDRKPLVIKQ